MSLFDTVKNIANAEAKGLTKLFTNPLDLAKDVVSGVKNNSDAQSNWFSKAFSWTPLGAATGLMMNAAKDGDISGTKSK